MAGDKQKAKVKAAKTKGKASFRSTAMGKLLFAFDFGEFSVKVAVLKIKKTGIELRYLFSVENRENLTKLDSTNVRAWRTQIQKAFSSMNIIAEDHLAVCSIGGKAFIHRQIEIPYVEEKDRNGLVENEMSQMLALDTSTYVFQHEVIEVVETGEEKRLKVWAVAMPKETSAAAYELIRSLRLKPVVMDIHANGMRRFLKSDENMLAKNRNQTVACIDYGMTHTELLFIRDGELLGDTLIDEGDERLVSEARNAIGIRCTDPANPNKIIASPQDICNILNKAHTTAEERSFSLYVKDWLSKVNTAITRFNFDHPSDSVQKIYLYGGSPQNIWLVQYLQSVSRIPAEQITKTSLFNTEALVGSRRPDYSAYLNVLNLSLMD